MNKKTLEALKGSIVKWEKIVDGTGVDEGDRNCPLCTLFSDFGCSKCPVSLKVYDTVCGGTPYQNWTSHQNYKHNGIYNESKHVECPDCKRLAKKEVDFLKSLLPKEIK